VTHDPYLNSVCVCIYVFISWSSVGVNIVVNIVCVCKYNEGSQSKIRRMYFRRTKIKKMLRGGIR